MRCTEQGLPNTTREAVDEAWAFYEPVAEMHNSRKRVPLFVNTLRTIIRECLKMGPDDIMPIAGLNRTLPWSNEISESKNMKMLEWFISEFRGWIFSDEDMDNSNLQEPPSDLEEEYGDHKGYKLTNKKFKYYS